MRAKYILIPENEPTLRYGFRYGLTLVIGTIKIMAGTGVFVRVVCALKRTIKNFLSTPSMIIT